MRKEEGAWREGKVGGGEGGRGGAGGGFGMKGIVVVVVERVAGKRAMRERWIIGNEGKKRKVMVKKNNEK